MKALRYLAAVGILLTPAPLSAQVPGPPPSLLTVQGNGDVRAAPDQAIVRVGILERSSSAEAAQEVVNRIASAILESVREAGLEDRQVQTSRLMLSPVYSRQAPGSVEPPRIVGYTASNTVSLVVEDLSGVGEVIDRALEAGANQLEGVSFTLRDDREARQQALRSAVAEAQSKAGVMADALGVTLAGIFSVSEGGVAIQPVMMEMRAMALQADAGTPVAPGEVSVSASVSIQYRIQ
jgi:hypothetical protein